MTAKDWRYVLGRARMLPKICPLSFNSLIGQFWRFIPLLRSCAAPTENKRKITSQLYYFLPCVCNSSCQDSEEKVYGGKLQLWYKTKPHSKIGEKLNEIHLDQSIDAHYET